jgi:hypothetical protein
MQAAKCVEVPADFELDGRLGNPAWSRAQPVRFTTDWSGQEHPELTTSVSCLWTSANLYFGFRCSYRTLTLLDRGTPKRIIDLYEKDVAEVFLGDDDRISHYKEFEVSPNGHWLDLEIDWEKGGQNWDWSSGNKVAARVDQERRLWTAEIQVPIACLEKRPAAGQVWPVNFYRIEEDDSRIYLAWSPTGGAAPNNHTPERFGCLHFLPAGAE